MEAPLIEERTKHIWSATNWKRGTNEKDVYFDCEGLDIEGNKWAWIEKTTYKYGEIITVENLDFSQIK